MNIKLMPHRVLFPAAFAFILFCTVCATVGQVKIGDIKDPDAIMGCSCSFQTAAQAKHADSNKFVFLSESGTGEGLMNINGKDTTLKLVKTTQNADGEELVGTRFYEEYKAGGITVRIDYETTRVCAPEDEVCEAMDYKVTITATSGRSSTTIEANGTCGC